MIKTWLVPLSVACLLFIAIRPIFAQVVGSQANLSQYLTANNVEVGSEVVKGFVRIFYVFNGEKIFVSQESQNSKHPDSVGEYLVWATEIGDGPGQIFLYHIPTGSTTQITHSGTNLQPDVDKSGKVVWESWVNDRWQIFFFDGKSIKQMTDGDESFDADIEGDNIVFTRRDIAGTYTGVLYSISRNEIKDIATGIKAKKLQVRGNKIILAGTGAEEEFPLTIDDLFLLNLVPLTATSSASPTPEPTPQAVSEEEVAQELEASASAEIQEASPSGESE